HHRREGARTAPRPGAGENGGERVIAVVLDCLDPEKLGAFWAEALRYKNIGYFEPYTILDPEGEPGPRVMLQKVAELKTAKNRVQMDIHQGDVGGEVARLTALGACRIEADDHEMFGVCWTVMADPEGNEFCVCSG